ncbi:MAG: metallophosphoesterase [Alphaproteobacteria bacterium]|nr:metallophosphoesterase [Alphaproteobacteria bacterium]
MRIAQITDTHLTAEVPARTENLRRCVAQINSLNPLPDLVVHTGDVTHNGTPEEYETARKLLDLLAAPFVVLAGNKDKRPAMFEAFSQRGIPRSEFAFVQYALDQFEVRIVCLDTVSENSNKGDLCSMRLEDLEALLSAAPDTPTAIFMHHPPFEVSTIPDPFQFERRESVSGFLDIIARHQQVRRIYCGHVHRPYEASAGRVPAIVMTAVALDLRKGKLAPVTEDTPLYLLHQIDAGTGGVVTLQSGAEGAAHR